jgi:hypothetical protein
MKKANAKLEIVPEESDLQKVGLSICDAQSGVERVLATLRILVFTGEVANDAKETPEIYFDDFLNLVRFLQETLEEVNTDMTRLSERCMAGNA